MCVFFPTGIFIIIIITCVFPECITCESTGHRRGAYIYNVSTSIYTSPCDAPGFFAFLVVISMRLKVKVLYIILYSKGLCLLLYYTILYYTLGGGVCAVIVF